MQKFPSHDPTVARLSLYNTDIGGRTTGGTAGERALQLSVVEIKPLESRLDIYWETSTCGLISELNRLIEIGQTAVEELPDEPEVPEEETEESEGGSEEGSEEGGEESVEEGGEEGSEEGGEESVEESVEETEENTEEEAEGNEQSSGKPANEGPES